MSDVALVQVMLETVRDRWDLLSGEVGSDEGCVGAGGRDALRGVVHGGGVGGNTPAEDLVGDAFHVDEAQVLGDPFLRTVRSRVVATANSNMVGHFGDSPCSLDTKAPEGVNSQGKEIDASRGTLAPFAPGFVTLGLPNRPVGIRVAGCEPLRAEDVRHRPVVSRHVPFFPVVNKGVSGSPVCFNAGPNFRANVESDRAQGG